MKPTTETRYKVREDIDGKLDIQAIEGIRSVKTVSINRPAAFGCMARITVERWDKEPKTEAEAVREYTFQKQRAVESCRRRLDDALKDCQKAAAFSNDWFTKHPDEETKD